jgi:recombination protein RecT
METYKNLVKTNYPSIRSMIESAHVQDQLLKAMASRADVDQMSRVVLTTIRTNQKLLECSQPSLLACLFACAQLRLSPEPFLGQAYFVPFWNSKLESYEATFIPGYKGMITLWRRTGEGHNIAAKVVYQNDEFAYDFIQWELGNYNSFIHKPYEDGDRGQMRGAWAVLQYKNGHPSFEYMLRSDLEKRRLASKSKDRDGNIVGPWIDWPDEMARKTVIKYALKTAPLSIEDSRIIKAAHAEDLALSGQDQKSLFLPGPEPIEIESESGGMDQQESHADRFDRLLAKRVEPKEFGSIVKFIKLSARANSMTTDEVKEMALQDLDEFESNFWQWRQRETRPETLKIEKQKKKVETRTNTETAFIDEWYRLQKSGFRKYVDENLDQFQSCRPETLKIAKRKWKRFFINEIWPGDVSKSKDSPEISEGGSKGQAEIVASGGAEGVEEEDPDFNEIEVEEEDPDKIWSQLEKIKKNHPAYYLKVTRGQTPKNIVDAKEIILEIESVLEKDRLQSTGGIPVA